MKSTRHHSAAALRRGFTLIELIGVLAIIAILASVLMPNALRSIERAAIRAEADSAANLGDQIKAHIRDNGFVPSVGTWFADIAVYSEFAQRDIQFNKRQNPRVLVYSAAGATPDRAMILSSMRAGLAIPALGTLQTDFNNIWNTTPDYNIPGARTWPGWGAVADSGQYLVVERLNFRDLYTGDLQTYTVTLNNVSGAGGSGGGGSGGPGNSGNGNGNGNGGGNNGNGNGNGGGSGGGSSGTMAVTASYRVVYAKGTAAPSTVNLPAGASAMLSGLRTGDRVELFAASGGSSLNYSYVVSRSGRTFEFDGTQWMSY